VNLKLFLQIIKARLWIIALILLGTIATAAVVTLQTPSSYTAVTTVVLDVQGKGPFDPVGASRNLATGYQATQVDIIESRSVALRVVDLLTPASKAAAIKLYLSPEDAQLGDKVIRPMLAGTFQDGLNVRPAGASQVLSLEFSSENPNLAAEIADAFAKAYTDVSLELQVKPARRNARWFDGQLKDMRARLEEKQRLLTAYQRDRGIVSIDERLDVENRRYQELATALVVAQTNRYDVESRQLGRQHPEYLRAIDRERSVQASLNRQKQKVLEIQQQRDELNLMVRELENSRTVYDQALQQFNQSTMQSQFTGTNVAILSKAALPASPSSPNIPENMTLAVLLGLVLGFGVAFLLEVLNRRIRISEDLSQGLGVPVLASLRPEHG
jgi:uncharacterized protein involved in exopolysaccharide biosynthesis